MTINVEAVVFPNRNGNRLFGTLHTPHTSTSNQPLIVLLSPGVKMRVGPHRLYNRMTAEFNRLGFTVFKFDFLGLGDSEGELDRSLMAEVYNDTETGAFVEDSSDALDWLQKTLGVKSFLVGGLCGGAITGILLASNDERVKGLISLGMTVTLAMRGDRMRFASQGELASLGRRYLRRLLRPKSWLRLITFQSDYRTISRSIARLFKKNNVSAALDNGEPPAEDTTNANPLFPPSFFSMTRTDRKIILIFSGSDRLYWEFDEKFAQPYAAKLAEVEDAFELHVVKDANHVFSFREWEQEMLDLVCSWLRKHYCEAETADPSSHDVGKVSATFGP